MGSRALVIGGTGFMGRRLVSCLLSDGWDVTVATSGRANVRQGESVRQVTFDRFGSGRMKDALAGLGEFDVVFDHICFSSLDAQAIIEWFEGRAGHYVFISSGAVYEPPKKLAVEADFDPYSYPVKIAPVSELGYGEGKRSAEALFMQKAPFGVAAARFPIVLGYDDSSNRFQEHVQMVANGRPVAIPGDCGPRNYVWVEDAGRFMAWLGKGRKRGPYNAAAAYRLDARELVDRIGRTAGRQPVVTEGAEGEQSPFYIRGERSISTAKARGEGFTFTPFDDWFDREVSLTLRTGGASPNSADYWDRLSAGGR